MKRITDLMWVPVTVKDHNCVGSLQVQAQASSSCAQQEDEVRRVLGIEQGK